MKVWMLTPLVIFIAIAGYQFGYYHAKIEISDAQKARLASSNEESDRLLADKVVHKVTAAEIPASAQKILVNKKSSDHPQNEKPSAKDTPSNVEGVIDKVAKTSQHQFESNKAMEDFVDNYRDEGSDIEIATQITNFFTQHLDGDKVYFHHVRCDARQCNLVGQFDGKDQDFATMMEKMKQQDWYPFGSTSSNTSSDDSQTHFILHLTDRKTTS
ncbi:hypothetical protein [Alteromonas sp. ASW11-130]|uniref:hypothetical protein n=1 Tax=Alteromonas sp. ASW11-130 TaxID=3015775 RepID=UPI0022428425|nr:hypothetical protein [Alteromonas sp. ASW11-130]MCW8090778.1 hypothetical protein [Alteromonas sp. ASW11-130]